MSNKYIHYNIRLSEAHYNKIKQMPNKLPKIIRHIIDDDCDDEYDYDRITLANILFSEIIYQSCRPLNSLNQIARSLDTETETRRIQNIQNIIKKARKLHARLSSLLLKQGVSHGSQIKRFQYSIRLTYEQHQKVKKKKKILPRIIRRILAVDDYLAMTMINQPLAENLADMIISGHEVVEISRRIFNDEAVKRKEIDYVISAQRAIFQKFNNLMFK